MRSDVKFGILGSGVVAQTVGAALSGMGHPVMLGTRDPSATLARTEPGRFGTPSFKDWRAANPRIEVGTFARAAAFGEWVVMATDGANALAALTAAGPANLAGKVVIDITNPLDYSRGFPPSLTVCNTDSLGEQIQKAAPQARVVKTLNTVNAWMMVGPRQLAGGDHTMFVSGNDAAAKESAKELLAALGWKDVIDLGDITSARGQEMYLPLWTRIFGATQKPMFNVKVVR